MEKDIRVDIFRPQYAKGISECFRAVYGDGYPIKTFYDTKALEEEFKSGNLYPVVAIDDKDRIVGVMAVYRSSAAYKGLYEAGAGIVIPAFRGQNIAHRLYSYICTHLLKNMGIEEMFGESVCNHIKIQKMVLHYENVETGIEIDLMPGETYSKEKSSSGRVSVDIHFMCLKDKPHKVFIPRVYEEEFMFLYEDKRRSRIFSPSDAKTYPDLPTEGQYTYYNFAKVGRLLVSNAGNDFLSFLDAYEKDITEKGAVISQVFLRLDQPWVGLIVDDLRKRGYFLGGILPRWFDTDGMLMQKVYGEPNWDGINLYSDRAKQILTYIRADWERLQH